MNKFLLAVGLLMVLSPTSEIHAAQTRPTSYILTIKRIEASTNGGSTYVSVATGNRSFNVLSTQSSGSIIGEYVQGADPPPGAYNRLRIVFSNSITVSGRVAQDAGVSTGTTFCTGGTTGVGCTPSAITVSVTNVLVAAAGLTLPAGVTISDAASEITYVTSSLPFVVGTDTPNTYKILIETANTLVIQSDDTIHPHVPVISLTSAN